MVVAHVILVSALGPNPSFFLFWGTFIHLGGLLGQGPDLDLDQGLTIIDLVKCLLITKMVTMKHLKDNLSRTINGDAHRPRKSPGLLILEHWIIIFGRFLWKTLYVHIFYFNSALSSQLLSHHRSLTIKCANDSPRQG